MASSVELRAPFLDHRVVEFAFARVPDEMRANRSERKVLLRRVAERLLPQGLDLSRKQGFTLPLDAWFRGRWGAYMEEILGASADGFLSPAVVQELLGAQRRGYRNANRLFALTMLELWRREYGASLAA